MMSRYGTGRLACQLLFPGSYPVVSNTASTNNYAIEESRIRGGYNNTTVDFGVKAYIVEDERIGSYRKSSFIYFWHI